MLVCFKELLHVHSQVVEVEWLVDDVNALGDEIALLFA
jgi:hypothetical protein